jgi:MYXO-CTERM domain-containing protein
VTGNTKCGQKKSDQNGGGGGVGFVVLALLGGLGLYRRRAG